MNATLPILIIALLAAGPARAASNTNGLPAPVIAAAAIYAGNGARITQNADGYSIQTPGQFPVNVRKIGAGWSIAPTDGRHGGLIVKNADGWSVIGPFQPVQPEIHRTVRRRLKK